MVHFSKLRLYGFKSFVDKTELEIGVGLNGIVGPNGCGKSNLVEALRWVMGEKSAKNMRGGGMEDVIFAGTSKRPARNLAEVTVVMNNEDGTAPAPFNAATEIEINRKIERDKGSQYRVNGKAVRARDVNLLFADTATGASSPALVSQGRITEIIVAKPTDRRKILEESAGISGLHSRRHESELRLRAAENNLTRLDDVLGEMRTRLSSLKRQARQAERYKELNDKTRRLDMALSWSEWQSTHTKIKGERDQFVHHNDIVQSALEVTKKLSTDIETAEINLPDLRKSHLETQAVLQNFRVSLERLEQDIQSKTKGLQDAIEAQNQINRDSEFTQDQQNQILKNIEDCKTQLDKTIQDGETLPTQIEAAQAHVKTAKTSYDELVAKRQELQTAVAVASDNRQSIQNQQTSTQSSLDKIENNVSLLKNSIAETEIKINDIKSDDDFAVDLSVFEKQITSLKQNIETTSTQYSTATETYQTVKSNHDDLQSKIQTLNGEIAALSSMVNATSDNDISPEDPLLSHLDVTSGYEKAVSSALGQWASMAGIDDNASVYWAGNGAVVPHPTGTKPLSDFVDAPDALAPLLNAIGVVETLSPQKMDAGQMIVARDGSFMRWDGLIVSANASQSTDQTHIILEQKNRLLDLEKTLASNDKELEKLSNKLETASTFQEDLSSKMDALKSNLSDQETALREQSYAKDKLQDQFVSLTDRLNDQRDRFTQNTAERDELAETLRTLMEQLNASDDSTINETLAQIETLNNDIATAEQTLDTARHTLVQLQQDQSQITRTVERLNHDIVRQTHEKDRLSNRLNELTTRADAVDTKIMAYRASTDEDTDAAREDLLTKIATQTGTLQKLSDTLETSETTYRNLQVNLREQESKAATAREDRARVSANVANAETELKRIETTIFERFEMNPQTLEEQTYSLFDNDIPSIDDLHDQKETVTRQRDGIGPVNLRAALESQETETQLAEMEAESNDLTKAIEQLRTGIAKLNREAKERLAIAFTRVDNHFQRLFSQLFEGGKAHLEMVESDDPMEGGLEIYAEPPGKSLQKLSLLSGGEQTLTAIALIFAMFLTNPSPICVLDEIDAPLDDANVDRVCTLMESIARETETRFIVITHHRMTMARMDRLYGVTMSERGVSQLVSVDMALQGEMELLETA